MVKHLNADRNLSPPFQAALFFHHGKPSARLFFSERRLSNRAVAQCVYMEGGEGGRGREEGIGMKEGGSVVKYTPTLSS